MRCFHEQSASSTLKKVSGYGCFNRLVSSIDSKVSICGQRNESVVLFTERFFSLVLSLPVYLIMTSLWTVVHHLVHLCSVFFHLLQLIEEIELYYSFENISYFPPSKYTNSHIHHEQNNNIL